MIAYLSDWPSGTVLGPTFSIHSDGVATMGGRGGCGINGCTGAGGTAPETTGGADGTGTGWRRGSGGHSTSQGGQITTLRRRGRMNRLDRGPGGGSHGHSAGLTGGASSGGVTFGG